jgi:hypothetical protein
MTQAGLAGVSRRRFVTTTVKDDGRQAPDVVEHNFTAGTSLPAAPSREQSSVAAKGCRVAPSGHIAHPSLWSASPQHI